MDVLALIVAGLALGFSVYSFFREDRLNRRLAAIEEARREDEVSSRLRADVTAWFSSFVNSRGNTGYELTLANRGPARAGNVTFEIRKPEKGDAPFPQMEGHSFPISLDPGQE